MLFDTTWKEDTPTKLRKAMAKDNINLTGSQSPGQILVA
jgi:hypothetical protein